MKKFLSVLMALCLIIPTASWAFAEETTTRETTNVDKQILEDILADYNKLKSQENVDENPKVYVDDVSCSPAQVNAGDEFKITFKLHNTISSYDNNASGDTATMYNTSISFNYSSDTFIPDTFDTVYQVGKIEDGHYVTKTYTIKTSADMKTGYYPLDIIYSYTDKAKSSSSTDKYTTYIYVNNPNKKDDTTETTTKTTPRIILSNYSIDVDNVMAGSPFTFNFALKNTNSKVSVGNMKITVTSSDGIFTPVQGSNSFYTDKLSTGATSDYSIQLMPKAAAETKSYPITVSIEYEDDKGTSYNTDENINLLVTQPIKVEVIGFEPTPEAYGMNPINIDFKYFNKGKSPLSNLSIAMEGDFTFIDGDQYVGALAASSYDEFSGMIMPNGVGEQSGTLVLKFEDSTGTEQRVETPFTINVMEDDGSMGGGMDNPDFPDGRYNPDGEGEIIGWDDETGMPIYADSNNASSGLAWWIITLICVGGAAVVTVVTVIIVKKVKAKKAQESDDDDE